MQRESSIPEVAFSTCFAVRLMMTSGLLSSFWLKSIAYKWFRQGTRRLLNQSLQCCCHATASMCKAITLKQKLACFLCCCCCSSRIVCANAVMQICPNMAGNSMQAEQTGWNKQMRFIFLNLTTAKRYIYIYHISIVLALCGSCT